MKMQQHYITFFSPGSFVAEMTTRKIYSWDIEQAKEMAQTVLERYNATPFAFRFSTNSREDNELDSKEVAKSCLYYLGGKVETAEEVLARADPGEDILRSNIRCNKFKRIITNCNSWKHIGKLNDDDVVLEFTPRRIAETPK